MYVIVHFLKIGSGCVRLNQKKIGMCKFGFGLKSLIWARFAFYITRMGPDLLATRLVVGVGLHSAQVSN